MGHSPARYRFPLIFFAGGALACSGEGPMPASVPELEALPNEAFLQSWTRSQEEESAREPGIQIYRPSASWDFPAARFRNRYDFQANGNCAWRVIHPRDAHYMEPAVWTTSALDPDVVSIVNRLGVEVVRFRVLELEGDRLRIESRKYQVPECNYLHGRVDVRFLSDARFGEVDAYVQELGLPYAYHARGEVLARAVVLVGDPEELRVRLEAEPSVQRVVAGQVVYPAPSDFLVIFFADDITLPAGAALLRSYPDLAPESLVKQSAAVRFEVPVGDEDAWVARFREAPLVASSEKAESLCP